MIVCVCRAVSELDIIDAMQQDTLHELIMRKSPGSVCGTCVPIILEMIQTHKEDEHSPEND